MFVPYLFRAIRLNLIWGMQKIYYETDEFITEDEQVNPLMQSYRGPAKATDESGKEKTEKPR